MAFIHNYFSHILNRSGVFYSKLHFKVVFCCQRTSNFKRNFNHLTTVPVRNSILSKCYCIKYNYHDFKLSHYGTNITGTTIFTAPISSKSYQFPEVKEDELEESFARGSGPGGQAVNKTANCCVLKHIPTGIIVKCHASRSLDFNRKQARQIMKQKLDIFLHGKESFSELNKVESAAKLTKRKRRTNKRLEIKKIFNLEKEK